METLQAILEAAGVDTSELRKFIRLENKSVLSLVSKGGDEALALWRKLRTLTPQTKFWPVILGSEKDASEHETLEPLSNESIAETLAFSSSIIAAKWFDIRREELLRDFMKYNEGEDPDAFTAPEGEWPDGTSPSNSFTVPYDLRTRKAHIKVVIALVPTERSWEVPAYLFTGGWNECPEASVHCALAKYWFEKYGAEIVALTHDVVEMSVSRPPTTREAALALAREQYAYCADIVDQGTESIAALAAALLNGKAWFFWWD
jgi:hypothetical protein